MRFEKIGRKIDNAIADVTDWFKTIFYTSSIYRIYVRYKVKKYIKQKTIFETKNHLAAYLEYAIQRGWFDAEESAELIKKWEES